MPGRLPVATKLRKRGAKITGIPLTAVVDCVDNLRWLLDQKADPNAKDQRGERPLVKLATEGNSNIFSPSPIQDPRWSLLLERKADLNTKGIESKHTTHTHAHTRAHIAHLIHNDTK
jgi:hypothetical protein